MPEVEAVAVAAQRCHPGLGEHPPGQPDVADNDQHQGGDDRERDADHAVPDAAAGRSEEHVRRDCRERERRCRPGSTWPAWAVRCIEQVQGERPADEQLGCACGRTEVEPVRGQGQRGGVQHERSDHGDPRQPPRTPLRTACSENRERPEQVEVPLHGQRPGVGERMQGGQPETALLQRRPDRCRLSQRQRTAPRGLDGGDRGAGGDRVEQRGDHDEPQQRRIEAHDTSS